MDRWPDPADACIVLASAKKSVQPMPALPNFTIRILPRYGAVLILLCCALSACERLLFDNRTITSGKFEAFRIGASKAEVLAGIQSMPAVTGMHAIPPFAITQDHLERLAKIPQGDFLAIDTWSGKDHAAQVCFQFIDGLSKATFISPRGAPPEVVALEHKSLADFQSGLARLYEQQRFTVTARLILDDKLPRVVSFKQSDAEIASFAETRDGWEIANPSEQPVGASVEFYFEEGKLVKMEYHRTRTSLEMLP